MLRPVYFGNTADTEQPLEAFCVRWGLYWEDCRGFVCYSTIVQKRKKDTSCFWRSTCGVELKLRTGSSWLSFLNVRGLCVHKYTGEYVNGLLCLPTYFYFSSLLCFLSLHPFFISPAEPKVLHVFGGERAIDNSPDAFREPEFGDILVEVNQSEPLGSDLQLGI